MTLAPHVLRRTTEAMPASKAKVLEGATASGSESCVVRRGKHGCTGSEELKANTFQGEVYEQTLNVNVKGAKALQRRGLAKFETGQLSDAVRAVLPKLLAADYEGIEQMLQDMAARSKISKAFYHCLIHACAKAGNPDAAVWVAVRMGKVGLKPNIVTFNSMINACAKACNLPLALQWWQLMIDGGIEPNRITFNIMISACGRARDAEAAAQWMDKMVSSGIEPCTVSFSAVIDAYAKIGDVDSAEAWFARMQAAGVAADRVLYNSLINACAKSGQPSRAEHWLLHMKANNVPTDEKTYNSVIQVCARHGMPDRAEYWMTHMVEEGYTPDNITFSAVIHACAKVGNIQLAKRLMDEIYMRGLTPNLMCYNVVLHACAQSGDHASATACFNSMLRHNLQPNRITYNCIIDAHAKAGHVAAARHWLHEMIFRGFHPDEVTVMTLLRAGSGEAMNQAEFSCWVYGTIIKAYAAAGNAERMQFWLAEMRRSGVNLSDALVKEFLQGCNKQGDNAVETGLKGAAPLYPQPNWPQQQPTEPQAHHLQAPQHPQKAGQHHLKQLVLQQTQPMPELLPGTEAQVPKFAGGSLTRAPSKRDAIIGGGGVKENGNPAQSFDAPLLHGRLQGIANIVRFSV